LLPAGTATPVKVLMRADPDLRLSLPESGEARPKRVFLQTFGCQMNEYDSAKMLEQLRAANYVRVEDAAAADLVLLNTCAIREKAEHKVYSLLGQMAGLKARNPRTMIGVGGCVAQQRGKEILRRVPMVDLVFGTDNLFELPEMLREVETGRRVVRTEWRGRKQRVENFIPEVAEPQAPRPDLAAGALAENTIVAQLAITKGCNNFCTFCIVPYTRGREVSREPENIVAEARRCAARGSKELLLLGQNVNSYNANGVDFVALLELLHEVPGLERLRYTSPHPKDFNDRLARAHRDLPRLCEHLHLPFQAGSNRILKAMRRNHQIGTYLDKLARARAFVPNLAISTDIIVGFPGETEADFQATLDVMGAVRFDQVYAFKFSPREGTPAATLPDPVPEDVKTERLARLFDLHERTVGEINGALVGTRQEVLVENPDREGLGVWGRTRGNKNVTVLDSAAPAGTLLQVEIAAARRFALVARAVSGAT
jgi:tRNA-2-methylthio-N6-dimethylallyladenosine synthase